MVACKHRRCNPAAAASGHFTAEHARLHVVAQAMPYCLFLQIKDVLSSCFILA